MPLTSIKEFNNNGRTAGTAVTNSHYDNVTDPSNNLKYASVAGRVWVSTADVPSGSNGMVLIHAQGDSRFVQLSFVMRITANPSQALEICQIRTGTIASSTKRASLLLDINAGNPRIKLRDGADVEVTAFTTTLARDTDYVVKIKFDSGSTTGDGRVSATISLASDNTPVASGEKTDANTGSGAFTAFVQMGKVNSSGTVGALFDDIALWDSAYDYIGTASAPPTLTVSDGGPYMRYTASAVAGGTFAVEYISGGTDLSDGIVELGTGDYLIPLGTAETTYQMEVTTSGGTDVEPLVVPALTVGAEPGAVREWVWDGEGWV